MTYVEFRKQIETKLRRHTSGLTWNELRDSLALPYDRPCPEWQKRLEKEIGLTRIKEGTARSLIWRIKNEVVPPP